MTIAHPELLLRWAKNRIYSKQVLHLTSTPPLSKIRSAGILSIWQKETTSSHIWTAIKFEYFDLTKIRFFEIPWFFPDFQQNFKFPDFSLQGFFFHHFPCVPCFPECVATLTIQDSTFHVNCLHWRQFAWNFKACYLGKIRKIFQDVVQRKFYPACGALQILMVIFFLHYDFMTCTVNYERGKNSRNYILLKWLVCFKNNIWLSVGTSWNKCLKSFTSKNRCQIC